MTRLRSWIIGAFGVFCVLKSDIGGAGQEPLIYRPPEPVRLQGVDPQNPFLFSVTLAPEERPTVVAFEPGTTDRLKDVRFDVKRILVDHSGAQVWEWRPHKDWGRKKQIDVEISGLAPKNASHGLSRLAVRFNAKDIEKEAKELAATTARSYGVFPSKFWPTDDDHVLIVYYLHRPAHVKIVIQDSKSQKVWEKDCGIQKRLPQQAVWDGKKDGALLPAGVYRVLIRIWWNPDNKKLNPVPDNVLNDDVEIVR